MTVMALSQTTQLEASICGALGTEKQEKHVTSDLTEQPPEVFASTDLAESEVVEAPPSPHWSPR